MSIIFLYILGPIIVVIYKILEHFNFWNYLTNRKYALSGLERLKRPSGFPESFIYNEDPDKKEFKALFKRIKRKTKVVKIKKVLKDGYEPSLLTTVGNPILLQGIPPEWEQENRSFYSSSHSVLMSFGVTKNGDGQGKGERCCTLGELEKWIDSEKKQWDFWLGVVVMFIFSIASIILRLEVLGKI
jgi:hypothetical protein